MATKSITILAIESSCDDTSASIVRDGRLLSNLISNQDIHRQYGGVVPELASREHHKEILPVVDAALKHSGVSLTELSAIGFTQGPGLLGSLLVGTAFAKGLAWCLNVPLIAVNHMEAHVMAHFIDDPKPQLPFICLTVSGGHTQIVLIESHYKMQVLGTTRDDAAGEAFDKIGKFLGLDYPAGPEIDRLAALGKATIPFTKPSVDGLDFSFSGLKTAVMYHLRDQVLAEPNYIQAHLHDICASVQDTIVEVLMEKLVKASEVTGIKEVGIAGGVSANSHLRKRFESQGARLGWRIYIPDFQYCTDNAGMIGITSHYKFLHQKFSDQSVTPDPRLKMMPL